MRFYAELFGDASTIRKFGGATGSSGGERRVRIRRRILAQLSCKNKERGDEPVGSLSNGM